MSVNPKQLSMCMNVNHDFFHSRNSDYTKNLPTINFVKVFIHKKEHCFYPKSFIFKVFHENPSYTTKLHPLQGLFFRNLSLLLGKLQVLCAAIEHTIPMRNVKVSAGGLGKAPKFWMKMVGEVKPIVGARGVNIFH